MHLIRRATRSDAPLLSKLGALTFSETFRGTCPDSDLETLLADFYSEAQVLRELSDQEDYFHLLQVNGDVLGYSRLAFSIVKPAPLFETKKSIELKRLYLLKSAHGKGWATELMRFNESLAREMGAEQIYLSVWEHNERAKAFYRKMGFQDSGIEHPFPIGDTPQMDYWYYKDL